MKRTIIRNCSLVLSDRVCPNGGLLLEGGKIAALLSNPDEVRTDGTEVLDGRGCYLAPGYIDLHLHGLRGFSLDMGVEHFEEMCRVLPQYGVTGILSTLLPKPKGTDSAYLAALARLQPRGAAILGFHLEGPFLALPGAIQPESLGSADLDRVSRLIDAAAPYRAIFSISPEFEGILDLIPVMAAGGTPVFITHTRATVEQTQAAIESGANHATHFYDVFPIPSETDPGVRPCGAVEAVLADSRVTVDFILDGEHVHRVAPRMALQCKGIEGVCLITDSNVGAGSPPGLPYMFEGAEVLHRYAGGPARIVSEGPLHGGLAGSGLTMDQAVRNAIQWLGVDLPAAVRMASTNPARVAGFGNRKGRILPGYDADLVLLDDQLRVKQTWVAGELFWASVAS
jgi:N-acetylglucosamine-6-phosphate deacetylase